MLRVTQYFVRLHSHYENMLLFESSAENLRLQFNLGLKLKDMKTLDIIFIFGFDFPPHPLLYSTLGQLF